jgi:hypothetical protein
MPLLNSEFADIYDRAHKTASLVKGADDPIF